MNSLPNIGSQSKDIGPAIMQNFSAIKEAMDNMVADINSLFNEVNSIKLALNISGFDNDFFNSAIEVMNNINVTTNGITVALNDMIRETDEDKLNELFATLQTHIDSINTHNDKYGSFMWTGINKLAIVNTFGVPRLKDRLESILATVKDNPMSKLHTEVEGQNNG